MFGRGETRVGLGALNVIFDGLGIVEDGFRVAGDSKIEVACVDRAGSTTSLIHADRSKWLKLSVDVVDKTRSDQETIARRRTTES